MIVHFETFANIDRPIIFALKDNSGKITSKEMWEKLMSLSKEIRRYDFLEVGPTMVEYIVRVNNCTEEELLQGYSQTNSSDLYNFLTDHINDLCQPEIYTPTIYLKMEFDELWKQ